MCGACECNQDYGGKQCELCLVPEVSGLAVWGVAVSDQCNVLLVRS